MKKTELEKDNTKLLRRIRRYIFWDKTKTFLFGWHPTGEEKFAMIAVGFLCIILAIGAIGSKLYVDQAKIPAGNRASASRQAVYTNEDFQPSLDAILKARGEVKK
jgi:hypothetical protein